MSETQTEKKLTVNDPVDQASIKRIGDLTGARYELADRLVDLEQQKIGILVSIKQLDDEKNRLFNKILMERGLPPGTPIEIDPDTGGIQVHPRPGSPPEEPEVPEAKA